MSNDWVSISHVASASVDFDPIIVSNEESDVVDMAEAEELPGSSVDVQPLDLASYKYEEILMYVDRIANPTFPLRDIQTSHVRDFADLIRSHPFDYSNGMIMVVWSPDCNKL